MTIPMLLLRLPEFAEIAWRDGKRAAQRIERMTVRAFAIAAERVMREGDLLAHQEGSDWFAVAMLSPARAGTSFGALDARAALERIAATMSFETGRRMELGWWPLEACSDIDEFARTREKALERGARERERYEFLATVGHELRTPLTSIRGYIETLLDEDVDRETSRTFLETTRREALRLTRLVDGMLEFSLLEAGAMPRREVTELTDAIRAAADSLLPVAKESRVQLHVDVRDRAQARIDSDGCMHALVNIVENAIKYSPPGGRVRIAIVRQDPYVCALVDDEGLGIPHEDRERIFEYGHRGTVPQGIRGKGVGLAIVRAIVERAGGRVSVTASPSGGARFVLAFPAVGAELEGRLS